MLEINLTGKQVLLAGTLDQTLVAVGATLHQAGAALLVHEESPIWGDLPHTRIIPSVSADQAFDIVVINAGWRQYTRFLETTPDDWDAALGANFETPLYIAQAAAKTMIAHHRAGRIVFLSSFESLMPYELTATTGTSLTMLIGLAKMMAVDLAAHGITVNTIAAGWADAEAVQALAAASQQHIVDGIPLGRVAHLHELGAAAVWLASDLAQYITGTVIPIDGGYGLTRSNGKTFIDPT